MPKPPKSLKRHGMSLFRFITQNFSLETHHLALLTQACQALDRAESARVRIEREGLVHLDRFGQPKSHVLLPIERDSRAAFFGMMTQLGFDEETIQRGAAGAVPGLRVVRGGKKG
jgi:hypothetical protein